MWCRSHRRGCDISRLSNGAPLGGPPTAASTLVPGTVVDRVIRLAAAHLGMDVCFVSQFTGGRQIYRAAAGAVDDFGLTLGDGPELPTTYCRRLVDGRIPGVVPDTGAEPGVSSLPITAALNIGAYVGVPLRLSDGTLYGTFCCMSTSANPGLSERDRRFLELLAEMMTDDLDRDAAFRTRHGQVSSLLESGLFSVALQPIVSLHDDRRIGVEALARFPAEHGSPASVFATAEDVGLTLELEILAASKALRLAPVLDEHEFLSINMSPRSIVHPGWLDAVPDLDHSRLVLEMTEHQAIDGYDELKSCLRELRGRGVRLAIDDVGAGYASLHHVLQLHPDIVKIDRNLVAGAHRNPAQRSVIRGFVALAADIGATVVGEGVEEAADLAVLRELGVNAAQGYLLGRPTLNHAALRTTTGVAAAQDSQVHLNFPQPRPRHRMSSTH